MKIPQGGDKKCLSYVLYCVTFVFVTLEVKQNSLKLVPKGFRNNKDMLLLLQGLMVTWGTYEPECTE